MPTPSNDVSQHATAAEVQSWLSGGVDGAVRVRSSELTNLVSRFKSNAQDPSRGGGSAGGSTPLKMMEFAQTDAINHTVTLAGMAASIASGHTAVLANASTIDNNGTAGAAGWGGIDSMTDSKGNAWTRLATGPIADGVDSFTTAELFISKLTASLANGDQLFPVGDSRGLSMIGTLVDCGVLPTSPLNVSAGGASGSWDKPFTTPATAPTAQANELLLAATAIGDGQGVPITMNAVTSVPSAWTILSDHGDATINRQLQVCYAVAPVGSAAEFHSQVTGGVAHAFQVVLVALKTT